jgi:hypothetical protein
VVEHVFHPIPEPASHALEVMRWLTQQRATAGGEGSRWRRWASRPGRSAHCRRSW